MASTRPLWQRLTGPSIRAIRPSNPHPQVSQNALLGYAKSAFEKVHREVMGHDDYSLTDPQWQETAAKTFDNMKVSTRTMLMPIDSLNAAPFNSITHHERVAQLDTCTADTIVDTVTAMMGRSSAGSSNRRTSTPALPLVTPPVTSSASLPLSSSFIPPSTYHDFSSPYATVKAGSVNRVYANLFHTSSATMRGVESRIVSRIPELGLPSSINPENAKQVITETVKNGARTKQLSRQGCVGGVALLSEILQSQLVTPERPYAIASTVELASQIWSPGGLPQAMRRALWERKVGHIDADTYKKRMKNMWIDAGLFGDAAVSMFIADSTDKATARPGELYPTIIASNNFIIPQTDEEVRIDPSTSGGMHIHLSRHLPKITEVYMKPLIEYTLESIGVKDFSEVSHWPTHPGGVRILDAYEKEFGIPANALDESREVLNYFGNCGSASALLILAKMMMTPGKFKEGDLVLVSGVGPGVYASNVVLRIDRAC